MGKKRTPAREKTEKEQIEALLTKYIHQGTSPFTDGDGFGHTICDVCKYCKECGYCTCQAETA
jgi:hypothetical protein